MVENELMNEQDSRFLKRHVWLILAVIVGGLTLAGCAETGDSGALRFDGTLAHRSLSQGRPERPIRLEPDEVTELRLEVTNTASQPLTVAHVRLEGGLLGFVFLTYDTGIHETIAPGEKRIITFPIDFFDLHGQTRGLLRAHVRLYGPDREALGSRALVVDGRGGPFATTVTFTLVLLAVALGSIGWNLLRLSQRRLPASAVARGARFLHSGLTTGLALSAASSVLRIWPLGTLGWMALSAVLSVAAFAFGYLSPGSLPASGGPEGPAGTQPLIDLTEPAAVASPLPAPTGEHGVLVPPARPPVRLGPTGGNITHGGTVYPGSEVVLPVPPQRPGGILG